MVGTYVVTSSDKTVSFYENRALAQKPAATTDSLMNGEFTKGFETYFTDQFAIRDFWVSSYMNYQQLTNQTYFLNHYVAEDNWIYPKPMAYTAYPSIDQTMAYMKEMESFTKEKNMELYFFSLPERSILLEAPYPEYISTGNEKLNKDYFASTIPKDHLIYTNIEEQFRAQYSQEELKELYFQTDHHWNIDGAFAGYQTIVETFNEHSEIVGDSAVASDQFVKQCYPEEHFLGSYNKQLYASVPTTDVACTITPVDFDYNELEVYAGEVREDLKVPYEQIYSKDVNKGLEYLEYAGVYTGDHREINIINPAKIDENTKALFVKDSYGNPLTLLLSQHFYQTTFYDMRYNLDRSLFDYIEANDYDLIVFLYNDLTIFPSMYDFKLEMQ